MQEEPIVYRRFDEAGGLVVDLAHDVRGHGSPIVLLPGTGYAGSTWPVAFVASLAEHHTIICPDYRGTGQTPGTEED